MKEREIMDGFHQGQIHMECILPIQTLLELEIKGKINEHGVLRARGILDQRGREELNRVGSREPVVVYAKKESGEIILFSGIITETELCFREGINYVTVTGLSWTSLLDYGEKSRSFQNKEMSYSQIIDRVLKDYPGSICLYKNEGSRQSTGQFLLQYRETDWEFMKRLATHFHTCLVADMWGNSPCFHFGFPKHTENIRDIESIILKRDYISYQKALAEGFFVIEEQFVKYHIHAGVHLKPGTRVEYDNKKLVVQECHTYFRQGILCHDYVLGDEASLLVGRRDNGKVKGVSLLGEVLASRGQQVKLKLAIDREQPEGEACWFPYASQANNLFYCMPETGTTVSLLIPGTKEEDAIAVNAVRKNGGSCAKTSDPRTKYMGIPEGKELKLGTTDLDFSAHEQLFLSLDGKKGARVQSNGNINIFTKQKLSLEAKELIKIFANTGNIVVGAKEQSSLYLLGGPEGDTHIKAGNSLIYEGRKKEIFTERLNSEIAYEEKKFDWGKLACNVLIGLAAVAAVVAVVATGGAALVAMGAVAASTVSSVVAGAAISGALAVGVMAVSDMMKGEVSDWQDYALAGMTGALEGAISGAVLGIKALEGAKLIVKMLVSGGTSFITDAIAQGLEICFRGGSYDWGRGLLSFGIGFVMPAISRTIEDGVEKLVKKYGEKMTKWYNDALCKLFGDPVDVINGNVLYDVTDFELPGPIPLQWNRIWCSASRILGHLGYGTRYSYEVGLEIAEEEHAIIVFLNDGRITTFSYLLVGEEEFDYRNKLILKRMNNCYQLLDVESRYIYTLSPISNGYIVYKLTKVENRKGHSISFAYNNHGYLCNIIDSVGRKLIVSTNQEGRITSIHLLEDGGQHLLVSYDYSKEQDLTGVTDAMGKTTVIDYRNHLMIKKTDRDKNSFYWEYDKYEDGARAVRTWGDGGILSLWIDYHDEEMYNAVRTGKNKKACEYHYNEDRICTKTVYPDYTEVRESYNDKYQLICHIDEEGRQTRFSYNELSLLTELVRPDASKIQLMYDEEGRLIKKVNPEGDCLEWVYNEDDTLLKTVDENGVATTFSYNQDKLVEKVWSGDGEEIFLTYDKHKNVSRIVLPNGSISKWEYDYRGNCLSHTGPLGAVETYNYDKLNRLVKAKLSDGNELVFTYNSYKDVIRAKDRYHEIAFTYDVLGNITSKTEGGQKLQYQYNSEGQLVSLINEKGEIYQLERDIKGNVIKETGYDKITRIYEVDYSGLIKKVTRPGGRITKYTYDKLCRVIRTDYHDKSYEEYVYNRNGLLIEVKNQYTAIKLERDKAGNILKEWQDEHWVSSEYDISGNRLQVNSSFGANILSKRDKMGQVSHMVAYLDMERTWVAKMVYNATGQEVLRQVSGGVVNSLSYDEVGRPISHKVSGERERLHRHYAWDVNYRLKKMANELTKGSVIYFYDRFNNLVSAKATGIPSVFRTFDEVGNVYGTEDRSDRIYGEGSRLEISGIDIKEKRNTFQGGFGKLVTKGVGYLYDEEGNLARKVEADGSAWEYSYYGNGMLRKVVRPDKSAVIFKYDALGRRIEKCIIKAGSEKVIRFLWDGNTILHEWEEETTDSKKPQQKIDYQADYVAMLSEKKMQEAKERTAKGEPAPESLITWIFQDDFIPRAKITKDGCYSIMTDYLGTPVGAYDEDGSLVWEREFDINGKVMQPGKDNYGRTMQGIGEKTFIPFRFQGQYEDEEISLYYNRFRYYDPETGQYTQQDPIGLAGENPTLYGYVYDTLNETDPYGLVWRDMLATGLGHHLFPRSVAKKLGISQLAKLTALSWYPNVTEGSGELHQKLHRLLKEAGVPFHGSKFTGRVEDFWEMAMKAYEGLDGSKYKGYLKIPGTSKAKVSEEYMNLTPKEGLQKIKELLDSGELDMIAPCKLKS